jgi:hypothetical protein
MRKLEYSGFSCWYALTSIALYFLALAGGCSPAGVPTDALPPDNTAGDVWTPSTGETGGDAQPAGPADNTASDAGQPDTPPQTAPTTSPDDTPALPDEPADPDQPEPDRLASGGDSQTQTMPESPLLVYPTLLELTAAQPQGQITLENPNQNPLAYSIVCSTDWLVAEPSAGIVADTTAVVSVTAYPDGLQSGQHEATMTIASPGFDDQIVRIILTVPQPPERTIAGWVRCGSHPLADVVISAGQQRTLTDATGCFSLQVPDGWSGSLAPRDVNYQFDPPVLSLESVHQDLVSITFAAARLAPRVPSFSFRDLEYHNIRNYQGPQPQGTIDDSFSYAATFDNQYFYAELRWLGDDCWELALTPRVAAEELWFPCELSETILDGNASDDVFFVTQYTGAAWKSDVLTTSFWGPVYPGSAFSPLVVHSDKTTARMAAATNWPPRRVKTAFARGRLALIYGTDALPEPGQTYVYRLIYTQAGGAEDLGLYAWQRVADKYKCWLSDAAAANGLPLTPYPQWLREADGLMNVHLEGFSDAAFARDDLINIWRTWKHLLPMMLMWGVTSAHNPDHGCCTPPPPYVHPRYLPRLLDLAAEITQDGHLAYYSRVFNGRTIDGLTPESLANLASLADWISQNLAYGANTAYIDVLGTDYFGDALSIARLFLDFFPEGTFIEYPVDVYPAAFWICNNIYAGGYYASGPRYTDRLDTLTDPPYRVTYPRFGRYILDDRAMFLGTGNNEMIYWGQENNHWLERQIFLLGLKFDVHHSMIEEPPWSGQLNYALGLAIAERRRVNWWQRNPRYCDRAGLQQIPPGIDIRRFVDDAGVNLFVIDNWSGYEGQSFLFRGQRVEIPSTPLSIVVLP